MTGPKPAEAVRASNRAHGRGPLKPGALRQLAVLLAFAVPLAAFAWAAYGTGAAELVFGAVFWGASAAGIGVRR